MEVLHAPLPLPAHRQLPFFTLSRYSVDTGEQQFSSVSKDVAPSHWLPLSCLAELMYLSTRVNGYRKLSTEIYSFFITKRSEDAGKPSLLCDYR